ncbi:MAG TPA: tetratricopeptide repeat protein [Bryobacteraceae bacterium]|nr:tetratricopeptide repeat protein [Bryobacteraceae bacterium]
MTKIIGRACGMGILLSVALCIQGQGRADSNDAQGWIEKGNTALAQNRLHDAAAAFQRAIDLDPSSAKAHEQLGVALSRAIVAGTVRPSADSDVVERAEHHLRQAIELAPFETKPLVELSQLEAALGEQAPDSDQRSERYRSARDLLKKALALGPGKADMYLRLANLERDEFGPAIQQAMTRSGSKPGPLGDAELRHKLQQQYGSLIEDAIANARKASEMTTHSSRPLLLMSRLLRERAVIRDTPEQYASDMHSADDWQQQFLVNGGHLGPGH